MRKGKRRAVAALALSLATLASGAAHGATLDVTAAYRMKASAYRNLGLDSSSPFARNDRSFISNDARLGVAVRHIALETRAGEETTLDLGLLLHSIGVAGSTVAATAPFNRASSYYPNANLAAFIENAYLSVHSLFGRKVEATLGRQSYRLGSGLLLDDDGAGLTGATARSQWGAVQLEGFVFSDSNPNPNVSASGTLDLFGFSLSLPTEGLWQLNQLFERDRALQTIHGSAVSKALRSFTSARYQLNYGPIVFEGEAALEKGAATPTGAAPAANHTTFNGNAQLVRAKWKQRLYRTGEGIARLSVARGSGDHADTLTTDEAFFPSHGHRYNGLERSGLGELYGATPYDAWGGNYSSTTVSGLREGASGLLVVGAGYTPPAYKGIALDIDYFLFQAERVAKGSRTLGSEWDLRLRYSVMDRLTLSASAAFFSIGPASNPSRGSSRKFSFEASGRF